MFKPSGRALFIYVGMSQRTVATARRQCNGGDAATDQRKKQTGRLTESRPVSHIR
jgi:hypothetical protein